LTYDGVIKVIDFGIAKADTNSEATQAGTIKGKLSYLAPEYLEGKTLDARYDQFAVGITLWEMLCSRKLFKAPNDLAVLKKIQECKIPPPSSINPNVPKELDEIVLKSLSKDRNKRFEDMDKFNRALMKFLYSNYPDFNATDLSYFAKELFKEEIKKDKEKLITFGKMDLRPYIDDMKSEGLMGSNSSSSPTESTDSAPLKKDADESSAQKAAVFDFGFENDGKNKFTAAGTRVINKKEILGSKGGKTSQIKVQKESDGSLALDGAVKKKISRGQMGKSDSTQSRVNIRTSKTKTSQSKLHQLDSEEKQGSTKFVASIAVLVAVGGLAYMNYPNLLNRFLGNKVERQPSSGKNEKAIENSGQQEQSEDLGMIFIKNFDKYKQKAFVGGKPVEVNVLGDIKDIPLNKEMVLRVEQPGFKHFVYKFNLSENQSKVSVVIPEMPNIAFGHLMTTHKCASGKIFFELFGESRVEAIPGEQVSSIAFPLKVSPQGEVVPTDYEIYFTKDGDDLKRKIKFTLNFENDSIDFCSIYYQN
jgi:serine/threonine protein kinase